MKRMAKKDYVIGSVIVFEDLGHPRPDPGVVGRAPGCYVILGSSAGPRTPGLDHRNANKSWPFSRFGGPPASEVMSHP